MTLNMTVLTRNAIYQSADFRLTSHPAGSVVEDTSAKIVVLHYWSWMGFVTYTGIGEWDGRAISDWIVEWLADGVQRSMPETAAILEDKMTNMVRAERRRTLRPNRKHTFTLAGFEDGVVRAFVISNFEDCYGNTHPVSYALSTSSRHIRGRRRTAAIVTGAPQAVPVQERRILAKLASKHPDDGGRIRRRTKEMNAEAAASPASQGLISADCAVISFRSDGYGNLLISDANGERPADIPQIMNGLDINALIVDTMKAAGFDLSNAKLENASWASTMSPGPPGVVQSTCTFPVVSSDANSPYRIAEISAPEVELHGAAFDIELGVATDVNDDGHIVGHGRERQNPFTTNVPWIVRGDQFLRLNVNGWGQGINGSDQAAVMVFDGTYGPQAGIYTNDPIRIFPLHDANGKLAQSFPKAINATGTMAGSVTPHTDVLGEDTTTAAIFSTQHPPVMFERHQLCLA